MSPVDKALRKVGHLIHGLLCLAVSMTLDSLVALLLDSGSPPVLLSVDFAGAFVLWLLSRRTARTLIDAVVLEEDTVDSTRDSE